MALRRGMFLVFGILSMFGEETIWWVDVRPLPPWLVALPGAFLLMHALRPAVFRRTATGFALLLAAVALGNSARYYTLDLPSLPPVPLTLAIGALLLAAAFPPRRPRSAIAGVALAALLFALLPVAHAYTFGRTSYARPADWIVVPGARCYADGRPTQTLAERVKTACGLYRAGYAPRLFFSGGPGDGATHESESMRNLAIELGVPPGAITLDREGLNTSATLAHSPPGRLLVVSHFYHLPRIKLLARRQGREAFTVPAHEERRIRGTSWFVAREVVAFWWYLASA